MAVTSLNRWCWAPLVAETALCLAAPCARAGDNANAPDTAIQAPHDANPAPSNVETPLAILSLSVTLNGQDRGLAELRESHGRLWITRAELRALGVVPPPGLNDSNMAQMLPLDTVPGALITYQASDLSLDLVVPVTGLNTTVTRLNLGETDSPHPQSAFGAVLNYDTQTDLDKHGLAMRALLDFRAFSGTSSFESIQTISAVTNQALQDRPIETMRFDTTVTLSLPNRRLTLRIGDTVTSTVAWSRATRLGGLQFGTDFSLQPYLVTVPIPTFFGSAVLPSTADVYVDGMRRFSGNVPPGPFAIGVGPSRIDGAGSAQLVLTNILGQISAITLPIYETPLVLRKGLDDWSLESGLIRRSYGLSSFSYWQEPAGSGSWRHGLTDTMTVSAHAEVSHAVGNVGVGGVFVIGQAGVVSASFAQSWSGAGSGKMLAISYTLTAHQFHIAASTERTYGPYADLASVQGAGQNDAVPRVSDVIQAGWSSPRFGNFGVNYVRRQVAGQENASYGGLFWAKSLGKRLSLYISGNQNFTRRSDRNLFLTLSFSPNARLHASTDVSAQSHASAIDATLQSLPDPAGGFGWKAGALYDTTGTSANAEAEWLGSAGDARIGAVHSPIQNDGYFAYSGSIAIMDGGVFTGRRVNSSFAVVSTDGLAHVPVTFQNRLIGKTDGNGRLLVADLNAYQHNQLGIDATNIPDGYQVEKLDIDATPAGHAGVAVHFAIRQFSGLTMTLVRPSGDVVAVGTPTAIAGGATLTVGFDGQLYIENPPPGARVVAQSPDHPCHFTLPPAIARGDISRLGTVVCETGP